MIGTRFGLSDDIIRWRRGPDSPDCVKVTQVCVDNLDDVDVDLDVDVEVDIDIDIGCGDRDRVAFADLMPQ